jgi:hypothetical protein
VVYLGDEADNSFLAIAFPENLMKRVNQKMEDWDEQGKSKKNLDSLSKRAHKDISKMKKAEMDVAEYEESQAHVDDMRVAQICAKAVGFSQEELFRPLPQEATQKALVALLSRPWFQRVWIIQEFVVAKHVDIYCRRRSVEWVAFLTAFSYSFDAAKVRWDTVIPLLRESSSTED